MKICTRFINHPKYWSGGGAERQMELIGKQLLKLNVDFHYIAKKTLKTQKDFEIINGIKLHSIGYQIDPANRTFKERVSNIIYSYDFIIFLKYFKELNFDLYHFRGVTDLMGFWFFFSKFIKRKKFIFTAPSIRDCSPGIRPLSKIIYRIYEFGLRRADVVIVLAEYMKKTLYQNYGVNSIVIKSGHPIPEGPFEKENPPTILWISTLIKLKRPNLFLKIAEELKDYNLSFILIGPGEFLKKEITFFAKKHENFTFIPGVPTGEDNFYYEKSSLLVNTSTHEGYPNSFIQAWLYETPVVSLDVDPDCDICKNGLGYHAKGDLKKLINEIKKLIENPSELKEMGRRCRKYAIKNHNIEKTAEQHYKLYKMILKK